jgi:mycofactocin precursor
MLDPQSASADATTQEEVHAEDVLVEDVSIEGMCGVY